MGHPSQTELLQSLSERGHAIIPDFLRAEQLTRVNDLFDEMLGSRSGRNDFEGRLTERIYTLVARDRIFQDIAQHPTIMGLCDEILLPNYLLTASQAIVIGPGETPQPWHTDDVFYQLPRPREMVSLSTVVAVDAFTKENGGTQVITGSHLWSDDEVEGYYNSGDIETDPQFAKRLAGKELNIEMDAGSCLVFAGTLLHRGGANRGTTARRALSNQYCQPWARTQENFFLGIPAECAAGMSEKIQSLLGYSIHPPFMGQVTASHPKKALLNDFVPPAYRKESEL